MLLRSGKDTAALQECDIQSAMVTNLPDERVVYLALKRIFQGEHAQLRQLKKIKKRIKQHRNEVDVQHIIQEYNIDNLCNVVKHLLEDQIFESTLKAKIRFPEVFEVSPAQTAARAISVSEAEKNEEVVMQNVMKGQEDGAGSHEREPTDIGLNVTKPEPLASRPTPVLPAATSLYPVYLPFDVQHRLLVGVQHQLEQACYAFAQEKLAVVLEKEGWNCAEAVELNRWPKIFLEHLEVFQHDLVKDMIKPFPELLHSIAHLRHTAVHRIRWTANRVLQFVNDAEILVNILEKQDFILMISTKRRQVQNIIEEMERNKDMLEMRQDEIRKQFAAKRAELDLQERKAIEAVVEEDREHTFFAGLGLEQSLNAPATVIHGQSSTCSESSAEIDLDGSGAGETGDDWGCV